jgi:hypothetical protein
MAYGKGSAGFGPNTKVYSFNLKSKDLPAPHFEVRAKVEGQDKSQVIDTATRVSGDLIGIKHRENSIQNKVITSVTATLKDGNEVYFVSIPYTYLGRNIMNSLCNLKTFDGVELSVYKGKPKEPGKEGFDSSAIRQGGELIYGKYEYKDLPAIPKVKVGSNIFGDSTAIDALFQKEVAELDARIRAKAPVVANDAVADTATAPAGAGDEVPF